MLTPTGQRRSAKALREILLDFRKGTVNIGIVDPATSTIPQFLPIEVEIGPGNPKARGLTATRHGKLLRYRVGMA